jgi:NAD(P)-dependent dehydrogenase (short-subunit alcohol dehydrogenase family)
VHRRWRNPVSRYYLLYPASYSRGTNKPKEEIVPDTSTEFSGRRALVTGGSRGIGATIAQRLLDSGAQVVTAARTATDDTPVGSTFIPSDVRSPEGAGELVEKSIAAMGGLDILVNNAGAARVFPGGATSIPREEWQDSLDINFLSAVWLTNAAADALKESSAGAVVNIASTSAFDAGPVALHYATAKAALLTYTRGMALELAPAGVRVNAVTPGTVETPGGTEVLQNILDAMGAPMEAVVGQIPLGRRGVTSDIAEMVAFLLSDRASWITGTNFIVDGGVTGSR